jgi:transposase-like protein
VATRVRGSSWGYRSKEVAVGRIYSDGLKGRAVNLVVARHLSAAETARALMIPPTTLRAWVRRYGEAGREGISTNQSRRMTRA